MAQRDDCPFDREELGRATWGLLHSMGARFPENPSKKYQEKAKSFVQTLALLYPCVHCAGDFQDEIKKSPPRTESRATLAMWLCEQHNIVNKKLDKPLFECTMQNLDTRWRTGTRTAGAKAPTRRATSPNRSGTMTMNRPRALQA